MASNVMTLTRSAAALASANGMTAGDVAIVRNKFQTATDREFEEFMAYCRITRLNPVKGEAILIVYGRGDNRKATIITTQAGLRTIAERAGGYHPAKPGDTVWTYTKYHLERQRWLNEADAIRMVEDREKVMAEIQANMPPKLDNPAGLLECRTVIYKEGVPVEGIALWVAYAPLTPHPECFELKDTGDFWPNKDGSPSNRKRMRKIVRPGVNPDDHMILDLTGRWGKDGPGMLAKCADVRALKAAFPDQFGHTFITEETSDKMVADTMTACELAEVGEVERRQHAVGAGGEKYPWNDEHGNMQYFSAGQFGDAVLKSVRACKYREDYDNLWKVSFATDTFNDFWAAHKADALDVKEQYEDIRDRLPNRPKPVTIEHDREEGVPEHA